nr:MAG TPA: hypothetical protein [Caudoviricetes sp.]
MVSIHALLAESDSPASTCSPSFTSFNPRPPCGERLSRQRCPGEACRFQSTPSLRRATLSDQGFSGIKNVSIHALLAESDHSRYYFVLWLPCFNPRPPGGERLGLLFLPI